MTISQLQSVHRQHTEYIPESGNDSARPANSACSAPASDALPSEAARLIRRYRTVRAATEAMAAPLTVEDYVIQTMPDVSPTKWHLGHTSWFFEQFLLQPGGTTDYRPFHDRFAYIFNSYYVTVGDRHCRIKRGTLSRPTVADVYEYRAHVDRAMIRYLAGLDADGLARIAPLLEIGLNHEQQHQELGFSDIKHVLSCNPLYPTYHNACRTESHPVEPIRWLTVPEGLHEIGHQGEGFGYDNEFPRHKAYLAGCEIADRLVTNGEFLEFVEAGGYETASWWLSDGWAVVSADRANWSHPFYWHRGEAGEWHEFTLHGLVPLDRDAPVCHLSYFEADAYAKWRGLRLPTEAEWEIACGLHDPGGGNFQEAGRLHPAGGRAFLGDCWQWTASQYTPYPGYRPPEGALGEYNGKFMCNQFVLRGGSCVTPRTHLRPTYRNFFPPDARWQFTGLRLARGV
jgi:ergothioneine biosynthesis protein EgtB